MAGKLKLLVGVGIGYVLGTRAGRERYDQMMTKAQALWRDPRTQQKVHQAKDVATDKAAQAAHSVQETVQQHTR